MNKQLYLCHPLVLSSPTLMMHGHTNLKFTVLHLTVRSQNKQDMLIVPVLMPHERSRESIVNIGVGHEECSEAKGPYKERKCVHWQTSCYRGFHYLQSPC